MSPDDAWDFYTYAMTNQDASRCFNESVGKEVVQHTKWLADVFMSNPAYDNRCGDNGLIIVRHELNAIPGGKEAFRAALNGSIVDQCNSGVQRYIQRLVQFYGTLRKIKRKNDKYRYNDYDIEQLHNAPER